MSRPAATLDALHSRAFSFERPEVEVLIRCGIGALIVWWALSWTVDASTLLSDASLFPSSERRTFSWSVFAFGAPTWLVRTVLVAVATAGVGLVFGCWPRLAAAVGFVGVVSIQRLQPAATNAGDQLLRVLLVWVIAALVLGSMATLTGSLRSPGADRPRVLVSAVRFQVILIYSTSVIWKLQGDAWRSGEAVWAALNNPSVASVPLPASIAETTAGIAVLTYGVLAVEAALPVMLLKFHRFGIAVSWALHLGFAIFLRVGVFTPAMMVAVLAFLEPDDVRRFLDRRQLASAA